MNLRAVLEKVLPESLRGKAGPALGRTMDRLAVPPPGLRAGRGAGARSWTWPAVVVLQPGAPDAAAVAGTVAVLQELAGRLEIRPVLVLDTPHFAPVRRAGLAADHVLDPGEWARRHPDVPYAEHLRERLGQLRRDYATAQLVTLPPQGAGALDPEELAAMLAPTPRRAVHRVWQRLMGRFEGAIDRSTSGA
ncbi:MAG TPA: hypothetical protein VFP72_05320 [Kineosporiaceae bacterium]|nr:hypothetical protein [Kineosporiaceae bacterium]